MKRSIEIPLQSSKKNKIMIEFSSLPNEILHYFCKNLESQDLFTLSLTCTINKRIADKTFFERYKKTLIYYETSPFLWKKIKITENFYPTKMNFVSLKFKEGNLIKHIPKNLIGRIVDLEILYSFSIHQLPLISELNALTSLIFHPNVELLDSVSKLPNLKFLEVRAIPNFKNLNKFMIQNTTIKTLSIVQLDANRIESIDWKVNKLRIKLCDLRHSFSVLKHLSNQSVFNVLELNFHFFNEDILLLNKLNCKSKITYKNFYFEKNKVLYFNSLKNLISLKISGFEAYLIFEHFKNWDKLIKLNVTSLKLETLYDLLKNKNNLTVLKCNFIIFNNNQTSLDRSILERLCSNRKQKLKLHLNEENIINMKNNLNLNETSDKLEFKYLLNEKISKKIFL